MALCIAGLLALTTATLLVRSVTMSGNLLMIVGLQMLVGCVTLLPLSAVTETWIINPTLSLALAFTYTTLFPGLIATLVWFVLVNRIGATRAASLHFLNPFLGVAIASFVLSEQITIRDLIGVAIVMVSIIAVQRAGQDNREVPKK